MQSRHQFSPFANRLHIRVSSSLFANGLGRFMKPRKLTPQLEQTLEPASCTDYESKAIANGLPGIGPGVLSKTMHHKPCIGGENFERFLVPLW